MPVSAASREANCCWPDVSIDCALDGSAPPVVGIDDVEPGSCAWARALANVDDDPVPVDEFPGVVPVALGVEVVAATDGSNAV